MSRKFENNMSIYDECFGKSVYSCDLDRRCIYLNAQLARYLSLLGPVILYISNYKGLYTKNPLKLQGKCLWILGVFGVWVPRT